MKIVAIIIALCGVAVATPDQPKRKTTPTADKFAKAAAEAFGEALAADEKGDLNAALGLYEKAQAIAPHPNTAYNIGDVLRRLGRIEQSIVSFETYLAMLPNAPDRKEVEAIVDGLAKTPGTLYITTVDTSSPEAITFKDFYFLVDGEIKFKPGTQATAQKEIRQPGIAIQVPPGHHTIDAVSAITAGFVDCEVKPGKYEVCNIRAKPRIDGRFVIRSADHDIHAQIPMGDERDKSFYKDRIELPVGKRRLAIRDRSYECPAIVINVPAGSADIGYLYMRSNEYQGFQRCRKMETKHYLLHFD